MANYLVTGGCGFIGAHLVQRLVSDGHDVLVLDNLSNGSRSSVEHMAKLIVGDIRNRALVRHCMDQVEGCFHLAAVSSVERSNCDWATTHEINTGGAVGVFEAASFSRTPVVYTSSAAVYGNNIEQPLSEAAMTKPITAYGADTLATELHARVASLIHSTPILGFRLFNVYGLGLGDDCLGSDVISLFIRRILKNQKLVVLGDGEQTRDFVHVSDCINYLLAGMQNMQFSTSVMNVCTGRSTSINKLVQILKCMSKHDVEVEYQSTRRGDIYTSVGDPRLAEKNLGVISKKPFYEGLEEILVHEARSLFDHNAA